MSPLAPSKFHHLSGTSAGLSRWHGTCTQVTLVLLLLGANPWLHGQGVVRQEPQRDALATAHNQTDRTRVSILPIELSTDDRAVGVHTKKRITEKLRDVLHGSGRYQLVERTNPEILDKILKELRFQNQGLVASPEVKSLGNLAGIDVFVRAEGELSVGWSSCSLKLKVSFIDVETSKLLDIQEVQAKGKGSLDPDTSADNAVNKALEILALKLAPQ